MPKKRVILELGSGNDLHGSDYTKAALRAVQDALHHSSLTFVRSLQVDKTKLDVEVTIGVQRPERVDLEKVKQSLPVGNVTVKAVKGGLDVARPRQQRSRGHRQRRHRGPHRGGVRPAPSRPLQFQGRRRCEAPPSISRYSRAIPYFSLLAGAAVLRVRLGSSCLGTAMEEPLLITLYVAVGLAAVSVVVGIWVMVRTR